MKEAKKKKLYRLLLIFFYSLVFVVVLLRFREHNYVLCCDFWTIERKWNTYDGLCGTKHTKCIHNGKIIELCYVHRLMMRWLSRYTTTTTTTTPPSRFSILLIVRTHFTCWLSIPSCDEWQLHKSECEHFSLSVCRYFFSPPKQMFETMN